MSLHFTTAMAMAMSKLRSLSACAPTNSEKSVYMPDVTMFVTRLLCLSWVNPCTHMHWVLEKGNLSQLINGYSCCNLCTLQTHLSVKQKWLGLSSFNFWTISFNFVFFANASENRAVHLFITQAERIIQLAELTHLRQP